MSSMGTKHAKKGINKDAHLVRQLFDTDKLKQIPTRNGYGEGVVEAGKKNDHILVLCADLTESTRSLGFKEAFPDRFVQIGVSEQSLCAIAAGMALAGKVPWIASYAAFSPGRNWEQIRTTVCLQKANVKIAGAHAGVSVGPDGATHQMIEDIAIMRVLPHMTVSVPCDAIETRKAVVHVSGMKGPSYVRFAREKSPVFTTEKTPYKFGRAETYRFGDDLTIIGAGPLLYEALLAAEMLSKEHGIEARVINMHTIKPLDVKTIAKAAKETGAIVTVEEAQAVGGLGGAVAEALGAMHPAVLERIGVQDRFGESGDPMQVLEGLGLTHPYIAMACKRALARKKGEKVAPQPDYQTAAEEHLKKMHKEIWDEAISRAPKKWGGKKPNSSLKSRTRRT